MSAPPPSRTASRHAEPLLLGLLLAFVLLVFCGFLADSAWAWVAVAGLGGTAVAAWACQTRTYVVGPILRNDLVRASRRGRIFLFRTVYALALLVVLYLLYRRWFGDDASPWDLQARPRIPLKEMARFAESFFHAFLLTQLAAVFLFTPAYVAGVIAEEKDRRTLDFLFVSDLSDREIIFSKLAARLLHLLLFLLTGLPVLMFATFFGGIDPALVIAGFVSNGVTMLSVAGTSLLCSVYAERTLTALLSAYLCAAGHYFLCGLCCVPTLWGRIFYFPLDVTVQDGPLLGVFLSILVHGWVILLCYRWACARLRPWYRIWSSAAVKAVAVEERPPVLARKVPEVDEYPLLWRERHFAAGLGFSASVRRFFAGVVPPAAVIGTGAFFLLLLWLYVIRSYAFGIRQGNQLVNELLGGAGTMVLCGMVLAAGMRAATSLGQERDRRTLEGLLALPVENREILAAKWQASFTSVRAGWWLLAAVLWPALFSCGLHWVTLPLQVLAGVVYVAFATSLGLWFSLVCRTAVRAVLWTVGILFALSVAPIWRLLSPLAMLNALTFGADRRSSQAFATSYEIAVLFPHLGFFAVAAWMLWAMTELRFGPVTGRMPYGPRRSQTGG